MVSWKAVVHRAKTGCGIFVPCGQRRVKLVALQVTQHKWVRSHSSDATFFKEIITNANGGCESEWALTDAHRCTIQQTHRKHHQITHPFKSVYLKSAHFNQISAVHFKSI